MNIQTYLSNKYFSSLLGIGKNIFMFYVYFDKTYHQGVLQYVIFMAGHTLYVLFRFYYKLHAIELL